MSEKKREILFRGKRVGGYDWVYGCYYKQTAFYGDPVEVHNIITSQEDLEYDMAMEYTSVVPETVGQFTGLTDKNGKQIFEGDIIEFKGCRWAVGFANTAFAAMDGPNMQFALFEQYIWDYKKREWDEPSYWEVVGNIHDNPELLEEGTNV